MDGTEAPKITITNIERATGLTGEVQNLVRFNVGNLYGNIATPVFETFAETEAWALAELHRISSQIAAAAAQTPDPSTPSDPGESERERKWRENQERSGPGWVV